MATATEAEEVASLDRVLTKLALTDEDKLERVLSKLLPRVIEQLSTLHDGTRKKVRRHIPLFWMEWIIRRPIWTFTEV